MAEEYSIVYMFYNFFIHSSVDGYLGYFHGLAIVNSAAVNSGISSVQLLSHVQLFATPWTAARQAFLSFTISQSLLKFMSIELLMPSNHLILLPSPFPFSFNLSQHQDLF